MGSANERRRYIVKSLTLIDLAKNYPGFQVCIVQQIIRLSLEISI